MKARKIKWTKANLKGRIPNVWFGHIDKKNHPQIRFTICQEQVDKFTIHPEINGIPQLTIIGDLEHAKTITQMLFQAYTSSLLT